jgi:hypothetical protein
MQVELRRLAQRHRVRLDEPRILPLAAPIDGDVLVEGIVSNGDVDLSRQRVRPWGLTWNDPVPLLVRHNVNEPAGELLELRYDDRGRLIAQAKVSHPFGKRCPAFSLAVSVSEWRLVVEPDDPRRFHGEIRAGRIDEISLTSQPALPTAIVRSRLRAPPEPDFFTLMARKTALLLELTKLIQVLATAPPAPTSRAESPERAAARSEFRALVEAMNANAELEGA